MFILFQLLSDTKIVNPYISGLSEVWATNSQQQPIKQGKTLNREKKNPDDGRVSVAHHRQKIKFLLI